VITVLVAARGAGPRARLEAAIAGSPGLGLVTSAPGLPLRRQVAGLHPDVVVLDLDGERIGTVLAGLRDEARAALVVLSRTPRRVLGESAAARDLVRAILPRDASAEELRAAVEAVAAGLIALSPDSLDARSAPRPVRAPATPDQPLTAREIEVLGMMADGLGNKIIAARLGISTHTAKFHVASIMAKLEAGSRTEAVSIGMRRGLVAI